MNKEAVAAGVFSGVKAIVFSFMVCGGVGSLLYAGCSVLYAERAACRAMTLKFAEEREVRRLSCVSHRQCSGLLPDGRPVTFECNDTGCIWILP